MVKRNIMFSLFLLCTILLCACSERTSATTIDTELPQEPIYGFQKTVYDLDHEYWDICVYADALYMICHTDGAFSIVRDDFTAQQTLYTTNAENTYLLCLAAQDDCVWVVESAWTQPGVSESEWVEQGVSEAEWIEQLYLLRINSDGGIEKRVSLDSFTEETGDVAVYDILLDGAGYVYVQYAQTVAVLNGEGEYQYALQPVGSYIDSILKNGSGNVFVASMADNEMYLQCYQAGVDTLLYEYVVDAGNAYYSGYDNYDVLCVTEDGIYGLFGDNSEKILSYSESGISFVLLQGVLSVDENLLCVDNGGLYLLKLVPADEITPVTVVTLGVFSDYSNLDWVIQRFNASSETYYVQKINYCADGNSYSGALQALNLDFLTGDAPDIILFSGMNYMQYSEKGFLLDILTLFEEDAQISVEDFFLTDTLQEDGHLYCIAPGFSVLTYYGSSSVFGQQTGWTYDDLCELLSAYGGFPDTITSVDFLTNALLYYLPDALDWTNGICNFDSEEFLQILSAAANIPDTTQSTDNDGLGSSVPADYVYVPEEILVANGQQLFAFANLFSVSDIGELENDAGCSFTFIGWPTLNGDSGSSIYLSDTITVNAASDELDGVWSFLKYCINDDTIQSTSGWLPVKKSVLEAQVVTAQNAENSIATDESVQKLYDLIVRTECVYQYDNVIQPIIVEEAAAYFAGEKSAEDTARIIQDRLSTYLAERR